MTFLLRGSHKILAFRDPGLGGRCGPGGSAIGLVADRCRCERAASGPSIPQTRAARKGVNGGSSNTGRDEVKS